MVFHPRALGILQTFPPSEAPGGGRCRRGPQLVPGFGVRDVHDPGTPGIKGLIQK